MRKIVNSGFQVIDNYYTQRLYLTMRSFKRPQLLSIIAVFIKLLHICFLNFHQKYVENELKGSQLFQVFCNIYKIQNEYGADENNQIVITIINGVLILFIFLDFVWWYHTHKNTLDSHKQFKSNVLTLILSGVLSIYQYVLFIPFLRISLVGDFGTIRALNFFSSILLCNISYFNCLNIKVYIIKLLYQSQFISFLQISHFKVYYYSDIRFQLINFLQQEDKTMIYQNIIVQFKLINYNSLKFNLIFYSSKGLIHDANDFDLRYLSNDYLGQKMNRIYIFRISLEIIIIINLRFVSSQQIISFINSFANFSLVIQNIVVIPFLNSQIQWIVSSIYILNFLISIVIIIFSFSNNLSQYLFISIFVLVPFAVSIARLINNLRLSRIINYYFFIQKNLQNNEIQEKKFLELFSEIDYFKSGEFDIFLRYLQNNIQLFYSDYVSNWHSLLLEKIVIQHKINCSSHKICFCTKVKYFNFLQKRLNYKIGNKNINQFYFNKGNNMQGQESEFLGEEVRKQYIQEYIQLSYRKKILLKKDEINSTHISYLSYIIDIVRNDQLVQLEIIKLKNNKKLFNSSKNRQLYNSFNYFALEQQKDLNKLEQRSNNTIKINSNDQLMNKLCLYDIYTFDQGLKETIGLFQETLKQKEIILVILGNDFVNLQELFQACSVFYTSKKKLHENLVQLIKKNKTNSDLINLCEQFQNVIDFDQNLKTIFNSSSNIITSIKDKIYNDHDSFVVFISTLKKENQILQVSSNFERLFPKYTNKNVIGKDLGFLIPLKFQENHKMMIKQYSEKSEFSKKIKSFPLQLAVDSQGWAIPLEIKVQNHQIGNDDIGICAWMKKLKSSDKYYISLQYSHKIQQYEILTLSQSFYETVFQDYSNKSVNFDKINISHICPLMSQYLNTKSFEQKFEGILFKPNKNENNYTLPISLYEDINDSQTIFQGEFVMYKYQNGISQIVQIQINSISQIQCNQIKKESLEMLRSQLQNYEQQFLQSPSQLLFLSQRQSRTKSNLDFDENGDDEFEVKKRSLSLNRSNILSNSQFKNIAKQASSQFNFDSNNELIKKVNTLKSNTNKTYDSHNNLKQWVKKSFEPNVIQEQIESDTPLFSPRRNFLLQEHETQAIVLSPSNSNQQSFNFLNKKPESFKPDQIHLDKQEISQKKQDEQYEKDDQLLLSITSRNQLCNQPLTVRQLLVEQKSEIDSKLCSKVQSTDCEQSSPRGDKYKTKNNKISQMKSTALTSYKFQNSDISNQFQVKIEKNAHSESQVNSTTHSVKINQKKEIVSQIKSQKQMTGLKVIQCLGLISVIIVLLINIVNFVNLENFLEQYKKQFEYLSWSSNIRIKMNAIFTNFYQITFFSLFVTSQEYKNLSKQMYDQILLDVDDLGINIQQLSIGDQKQVLLFKNVFEQQVTFKDFAGKDMFNNTISLGYALIQYKAYLSQTRDVFKLDQKSLKFAQNNFNYLEQKLLDVQVQVHTKFYELLSHEINTHLGQLIYVLVVDIVLTFTIIPIYYHIQNQKEKILKLLTTFSPDQLKRMLNKVNISSFTINFKQKNKQFVNQSMQNIQENRPKKITQSEFSLFGQTSKIMKKRNYSNTSNLRKFNINYVLITLCFLILLQFYSISIYFVLKSFQRTTSDNQKYMDILLEAQYLMQNSLGYSCISMAAKIAPQTVQDPASYIQKSIEIYNKTPLMLNQLYQYKEIYQTYYRINQNIYEDYLIAGIESNTCDIIQNYPEYITEKSKFSYESCKGVKNQILDKGLIAAIKNVIEFEKSVIDIAQMKNILEVYQSLNRLVQGVSLTDIDKLSKNIKMAFIQFSNFIEIKTQQLIDTMGLIHTLLLIIQSFFTAIGLYFGWIKFYDLIEKQIFQCKQMLIVIDLEILIENTHIQSFFKSNK